MTGSRASAAPVGAVGGVRQRTSAMNTNHHTQELSLRVAASPGSGTSVRRNTARSAYASKRPLAAIVLLNPMNAHPAGGVGARAVSTTPTPHVASMAVR